MTLGLFFKLLYIDFVNTIDHVVNDCRVCQILKKSVARPRVTLPKTRSFNEVVTLDWKEFGTKFILWVINILTRFMQGKLISNKSQIQSSKP